MVRMDVADARGVRGPGRASGAKRIVHLAAQAGVRYSIDHPFAYERSNLAGHLSVLEAARRVDVTTWSTPRRARSMATGRIDGGGLQGDRPGRRAGLAVRGHQAGRRADEHQLRQAVRFPMSGLRFFTVYGPWGRPDMAYFSFTQKILSGESIEVYGEGKMARDFTYIDDIVDGIVGVLDNPSAVGGHEIYNIGDNDPVGLMDMITTLEAALGREAVKVMRPMQPGDVTATYADISTSWPPSPATSPRSSWPRA
jgi:UDP-glucuronate 4-epimerase